MKNGNNAPQIRFKGFTDDWELRELGEVASNFEYGLNASAKEFDGKNKYIRITDIDDESRMFLSDDITSPDTDLTLADKFKLEAGDILFARTGASVGKTYLYREKDGLVYYAGFLIRAKINSENDAEFVFQNTLTDSYNSFIRITSQRSGQPGVNAQEYQGYNFYVPNLEEQKAIGTYFRTLDHLITLHQRKCETLQKLKKSMLQKMFPRNGSIYPEIRFAGFTDAWEQRELGKIYTQLNERNNNMLSYDKTLSVATMTYKTDGNGAADSSISNYKRLRLGDIAFEGHTSKEFRYGRFVLNDVGDGIMSPRFSALRPIVQLPIYFWKYYIHYEPVMRKVLVNSTKAGTMMNELVVSEFLQENILVPSVEEQQQIGAYFRTLDHLITLHQRKLETLKKLKKAMLQKMFI